MLSRDFSKRRWESAFFADFHGCGIFHQACPSTGCRNRRFHENPEFRRLRVRQYANHNMWGVPTQNPEEPFILNILGIVVCDFPQLDEIDFCVDLRGYELTVTQELLQC